MAIPNPEPGLVISYSYLWHAEHEGGQEEGSKDRPSVVVLSIERASDGATLVTVLPITHTAPSIPEAAIEIPPALKKHLGLDELSSWVVVSEGNEFEWPGYDLRKIPKTGNYHYGYLAPRFFTTIQEAFLAWHKQGQQSVVPRT